ncbi:MAG: hypothetical protein HOO96_31415 [Polyangiaceae bacterium]|nr:hypothetical protein [Polyangiaceae bacterium]
MTIREVTRKYRSLIIGGAVIAALGAVGRYCYSCIHPPAFQLGDRIQGGMSLHEVQARATKMGFEWRVDEATLMQDNIGAKDATGHIICHSPNATLVCENFADARSFGMMFTSHSCHIVVKDGAVDHFWLYMD